MADHPKQLSGGASNSNAPGMDVPAALAAAGVGTYDVDLTTGDLCADVHAKTILGTDSLDELERRVHP